jgi:hypothetical protein
MSDHPTRPTGRYFVLQPQGNGPYDQAARVAILAYAGAIAEADPDLAAELRAWASKPVPAAPAPTLTR